ncbi:glutamine--fructose-6-phosphate transaminase (isomerizing) [Candidatus Bathyarchaeota archaeon]|nr:glutamine--fructose-6-phosphate transaminase (isomerizing) [Candidatus Bathyarchaeota archaeon]
MCGIFGCLLQSGCVAPLIHTGLKQLEYRGYDSVGVATVSDAGLVVKKDAGKIDDVNKILNLDDLPGSTGIGHTRWATHGAPLRVNAHPQTDCSQKIAVVHNGIIENFLMLRDMLINNGHHIVSKTDTEVIPHLIEDEMRNGVSLEEAVRSAIKQLEGSYALGVVSSEDKDKIVCARNQSPLILGISDKGLFLSSDVPALLPLTNKVVYLNNGEMAVLSKDGLVIRRIDDGAVLKREPTVLSLTIETAQKKGYPHFMLKEIYEQPETISNSLRLQKNYLDLITTFLDRAEELYLVACGTSYNSCLAASYMFSRLCNLATIPVIASEFIDQYGGAVGIQSTILALSQSGETADVLQAIDYARLRAATILGLTNTLGSTLTRVSRAYICQQTGPEIGVAASKTFTGQLIVMAQLALRLSKMRGKVSQDTIDEMEAKLVQIPDIVSRIIRDQADHVRAIAKKYANSSCYYFLGRGISNSTALEGRLKLLEIAYIPSIAYPAGESKHGPISLIEKGFPVVFVCPKDSTRKATLGNVMEMKARGASIIMILDETDEEMKALADDYVQIPSNIPEVLSPIPYAIPLQLLAYYSALERGADPDMPRNLAKSVTVL